MTFSAYSLFKAKTEEELEKFKEMEVQAVHNARKERDILETMAIFDDTVKKIIKKDFRRCADDLKVCVGCDF